MLQSLPARFLSVLRFFFVVMRQPTTTDTCVFVFRFFYHARSRDNPCPDVSVIHIFLGFLRRPCLSKIRARIRSAIQRPLVRTLSRDRVLLFLRACEGLCRRVREIYLNDISQLQETGFVTSHLFELLGQRVSRTVYNSGCVIL